MEKEYYYCECCRRNFDCGKLNHIKSKKHKEKLKRLLKNEKEKIFGLKHFLKNPTLSSKSVQPSPYWCLFCDIEISNKQNIWIGHQSLKHLASKKHCKRLKIFLNISGDNSIEGLNLEKYFITYKQLNNFHNQTERILAKEQNSVAKDNNITSTNAPGTLTEELKYAISKINSTKSVEEIKNKQKEQKKRDKYPNKLGINLDRKELQKPAPLNWLPNFGSMWQEPGNSRLQTAMKFRGTDMKFNT